VSAPGIQESRTLYRLGVITPARKRLFFLAMLAVGLALPWVVYP
jgi:hypothetical protein